MADMSGHVRQAAALPMRQGEICLITSSNGKRWIIPKGLIEPGQSAGEAALQEAWEEAGLVGSLAPEPIGTFLYEKMGRTHHVMVFAMNVTEVADEWPERALRRRSWMGPAGALDLLDDMGLVEILRNTLEATPSEVV